MAKKAEPFDVLKWMFEDREKYESLTKREKENAFFIVNRMMAIQFPQQAELLNRTGGLLSERVDFWRHVVRKRTNKTPGWIFVKPEKPSSNVKKGKVSDINVSKEALDKYSELFSLGPKDIEGLMEFAPKNFRSTLKQLEKQIRTKEDARNN